VKSAIEMASGGVIYKPSFMTVIFGIPLVLPSFVKICPDIQKLLGRDTQTAK
jgi:hypothetical protein